MCVCQMGGASSYVTDCTHVEVTGHFMKLVLSFYFYMGSRN